MSVRFILRRDRYSRLRFASLQSASGRKIVSAYGIDPASQDSLVLIEDHTAYLESEAVLRIARHLRWPWSLAGYCRWLPRALRDSIYRWIARHRYGWFGRLDREWSPPDSVGERFL